ncbi:MAG TPA: hypothetical protein PLP23_16960 [Panacibacter sp.]|nr:hypothetical protein [Panacibacter sp.]
MSKKLKIYTCISLVCFAGTMFCLGTGYISPVSNMITIGIAATGALFSILSKSTYKKEKSIKN